MQYEIEIRRRAEKDLSAIPKRQKPKLLFTGFYIAERHTDKMNAQIIEKRGKKEFAVIPYKDYVRMQEELENYHDLLDLREAKADSGNQKNRSFNEVAKELGLKKKKT